MNKRLITAKIKDIQRDLESRYHEMPSIALMTGASGVLVFYYMLYQLEKDEKYIVRFEEVVDDIFERISSDDYPYSYCDGLAGVAFTIEFLRQKRLFQDENVRDALETFDGIILEAVNQNNTDMNQYDLLHGIFGCLYYLIEREPSNPSLAIPLKKNIEVIAGTIVKDILRERESSTDIPQPNCGLAHGNMSFIIVFAKYLKIHPENSEIKNHLKQIVDHQLSFKSNDYSTESMFPSIASDMDDLQFNTVLGWCYGDQTVAIGLYQANVVLEENYIAERALEIALHTAKRNTPVKSSKTEVTDAGFCHGMSAVATNNKLLYELTKNPVFLDNYERFTNEVLKRGNHPATISGFRRYFGNDKYEDVLSFLDGTLGVGVFLISTLCEKETDWEKFFLLK